MRSLVFLGLVWTSMLSSLVWESAEGKADLQIIQYKFTDLFPESFDWDGKYKRFIVGSTKLGKLISIKESGVVEEFVSDSEFAGKSSIHGVSVDATRKRVLAVVAGGKRGSDSQPAKLVAYDLESRKRTLDVHLGDDGGNRTLFNDVCVDNLGNAYVTETFSNSIWKVTLSGQKSLFVEIPQQKVVLTEELHAEVGINGIVYADGVLVVNQFNSGALMRVTLPSATVMQVDVKKVDKDYVMPAADGMSVRQDGELAVVSQHNAWLLTSRDAWRTAFLIDKVVLEESTFSTSVATRDNRMFVLAAYLQENMAGLSRENYQIEEIEFPADTANSPWYLLLIAAMFGALILVWKFQERQFNKSYERKRM